MQYDSGTVGTWWHSGTVEKCLDNRTVEQWTVKMTVRLWESPGRVEQWESPGIVGQRKSHAGTVGQWSSEDDSETVRKSCDSGTNLTGNTKNKSASLSCFDMGTRSLFRAF